MIVAKPVPLTVHGAPQAGFSHAGVYKCRPLFWANKTFATIMRPPLLLVVKIAFFEVQAEGQANQGHASSYSWTPLLRVKKALETTISDSLLGQTHHRALSHIRAIATALATDGTRFRSTGVLWIKGNAGITGREQPTKAIGPAPMSRLEKAAASPCPKARAAD